VATVIGGGSPLSLIIDIITGLATVVITCFGDQSRDNTATIYFNSDLNAAAPLPTQFKRVEMVESPGTIGKSVQVFTSDDDYAIWEPSNTVYSAKQRFAPWAYGLPKNTFIYDANGYIIKSTTNIYSFGDIVGGGHGLPYIYKEKVPLQVKSCKCEVTKSTSQRSTKWIDYTTYNPGYQTSSVPDMKVDIYNMYTGRVELKSTSEKIYKPNSNSDFLETNTEYFYNTWFNYDVYMIKTTQSNGDINDKFIKYTSDYSGGPISILLQKNIVSLPIETATGVYRPGSQYGYLSEKVTEFVQLSVSHRVQEQ
jgi:hypothetical protein